MENVWGLLGGCLSCASFGASVWGKYFCAHFLGVFCVVVLGEDVSHAPGWPLSSLRFVERPQKVARGTPVPVCGLLLCLFVGLSCLFSCVSLIYFRWFVLCLFAALLSVCSCRGFPVCLSCVWSWVRLVFVRGFVLCLFVGLPPVCSR